MVPSTKRETLALVRRSKPLLGTLVEVSARGVSQRAVCSAIQRAFGAAERVERLMSRFLPRSDVSRLNQSRANSWVKIHPWTARVLRKALAFYQQSGGAFCPFSSEVMPREFPVLSFRRTCRGWYVRWCQGGLAVDLGGIAKGFAVDQALAVLRRAGLPWGLVNAGGDLATFGRGGADVWIRNPQDPSGSFSCVRLRNGALANSGSYFQRHLRGRQNSVLAAGAFAKQCMTADALAKACYFSNAGTRVLLRKHRACGYRISSQSGFLWLGRQSCQNESPALARGKKRPLTVSAS